MDGFSFSEYLHSYRELLRVSIILILAWLLMALSRKLIRVFRNYMNAHTP